MELFDTHVHLTYPDYLETPDGLSGVITRARAAGVTRYVCPGLDSASSQAAIGLAQQHPEIIPAVGLHPLGEEEDLEVFRTLAAQPQVKAIGEIGTDRKAGPMDLQEERFRYFLDLARDTDKPALIHIRETWEDTFRILRDYPELRGKAVIHCFTGGEVEGRQIDELGLLLSVTAILARKNINAETLGVVRDWPLERMMLETDGPYLSWPGESSPNEPVTVRRVAEFVANLKGVSIEEVAEKTTQTARKFFSI